MDLDPHLLQVEPPEHFHHLFGCCCWWPIVKSARLVAFFSLVSFFINLFFLITAGEYRALHVFAEVVILLVELISIFCLFYGLSHKKAAYLKPYLVFGVVWNAFLFVLWLLCLFQLFDKRGFHYEVLLNVSAFVHIDADVRTIETTGFWLSISLLIGLGATIAVGCWFLHIVLSAYWFFVYRRKEILDQRNPEQNKLLPQLPNGIEADEGNAELMPKERPVVIENPNRQFRL
ncbi:hypothetical protein M3Y99_00043300 [Aphelenchoides fujianensis]|nr:hypothetical protein M3Y99_00043300 [Aphelenchoides fujianensis]